MRIVLVTPQIPQNTGSIGRTCAATQTPLHLIEPLGFDISEKAVRRAGLDYWPWIPLKRHKNWAEFEQEVAPPRIWVFTKFAERLYWDAEFQQGDALVFGSETKGLGEEFLSKFPPEQQLKIPMWCEGVRSLNLSNAVNIALYEGLRQCAKRECTAS